MKVGQRRLYKSKEVLAYEKSFALQCRHPKIKGEFEFSVKAYFATTRNDLDGIFKIVLDLLQKMGVIENDNKCMRIEATKHKDAKNPRIEFLIKKI